MRNTRLLLSALTGIALISCAEPTGPVASVAPRDEAVSSERGSSPNFLKNMDVVGTLQEGGTFEGKFTVTSFGWDEATSQLLVTGIINGFAYPTDGRKQHVRQEITTTATLSRESGDVAALDAGDGLIRPVAQTCDVLFLDLGPLFLDVLGLTVDLSEIILDINAVGGAGNLLGNLLCGLLGLLDGFPILANILAILEQINTLLGNLGDLLPAAA